MRLLARRDGSRGGGHRLGASLGKGRTEGTSCTSPVFVWCYNHNGKFLLYQRSPFPLWEGVCLEDSGHIGVCVCVNTDIN